MTDMTKKKLTTQEQIQDLRTALSSSLNNEGLLEETLAALEQQLHEQGWITIFGGEGRELSKQALNTLYDLGRIYWLKNPLIRRAVEVQALYVFAQGMTLKGDHPEVDKIVQGFLKDQKNLTALTSHQAWIQNERALHLSGNLFLAFFTNPDTGRVLVRSVPFSEITEIITNPDDRNEPQLYRRGYIRNDFNTTTGYVVGSMQQVFHPDWKYNPQEKPAEIGGIKVLWDTPVSHVKTNCLPDMRFGVSEIYAALDWAMAYKKFLENWSKLVEAYARFAFSLTTKGGARSVAAAKARIESLLAKTNPNTAETAELTELSTRYRPVGSTLIASEGVKLETIRTQGATTSADDSRRLLLMVASSSGIPEQILAGDPSTGNLATAKAMERPLELQFRNRQQLWRDVWDQILQYVIDQAIKAPNGPLEGREEEDPLTGETTWVLTMKDPTGDIPRTTTVRFPPLLEHDVLQTMQAVILGATLDAKPLAGTMDLRTVARQVLQALNVENPEVLLKGLFPGEESILQTQAEIARQLAAFMVASGMDSMAVVETPERVRARLPVLFPPEEGT